ncbi:hypothetical protein BD289DRAFT_439042 [Coniella lustricola]|uniref:Uncharacterized protein n=1 Tax=Coniella lustricola TaxID=2025994 RepID=A0A2T3A224_9PEZI|nr:hypothetical protein BD289DRAFT_439042 [Coniella lustricola]
MNDEVDCLACLRTTHVCTVCDDFLLQKRVIQSTIIIQSTKQGAHDSCLEALNEPRFHRSPASRLQITATSPSCLCYYVSLEDTHHFTRLVPCPKRNMNSRHVYHSCVCLSACLPALLAGLLACSDLRDRGGEGSGIPGSLVRLQCHGLIQRGSWRGGLGLGTGFFVFYARISGCLCVLMC